MRMESYRHKRVRFRDDTDRAAGREAHRKEALRSEGSGEEARGAGTAANTAAAGDVILRLKDNCRPYDPRKVQEIIGDDDPVSNIGLRMVMKIAKKIDYQNILGLNALTIRI